MSAQSKKIVWSGSFILLSASAGLFFVAGAAWSRVTETPASTSPTPPENRIPGRQRNLALQPEALKLGRRLGNRFTRSARPSSIVLGELSLGTNRQKVTVVRRQIDEGETVEVLLGQKTLKWSNVEGVRALTEPPTDAERLLVERLTFDSPDQFVLAQLRGSSYYTVARNVRPTDAPDDYAGPLWTLVRVDDSLQNETLRPTSSWRLYYINSLTGLIDRVVSQLSGQTVEAQIQAWYEQAGEKAPSHITWSIGGQIIMDFQVSTFSYNE